MIYQRGQTDTPHWVCHTPCGAWTILRTNDLNSRLPPANCTTLGSSSSAQSVMSSSQCRLCPLCQRVPGIVSLSMTHRIQTYTLIAILRGCGRCGRFLSGCGGELKDVNGTFASPNLTDAVTTAFTCRWTIHVPARRNVNLRLTVTPGLSTSIGTGDGPAGGECRSSYVLVLVEPEDGGRPMTELGSFCTAVSTLADNFSILI